jgi:SH3 domain-containing protein
MAQSTQQAKLCPHCANSIALDAVKCPYCRAQLSSAPAPEWAERSSEPVETSPVQRDEKSGGKFKLIALAGAVVLAMVGVFWLGQWPRNDRLSGVTDNSSELREKEQKIQSLEAELAKLREGNQGSSSQIDELKAKLNETQKDLAETDKKLADANREIDRLTSSRVASAPRPGPRSADPAPAQPAPVPSRRAAEPGTYETLRATTVYEEPMGSARVLTQIPRGTQVTVVRSVGEWLEVRSKHGNPPGFIRVDDAMFVNKAN